MRMEQWASGVATVGQLRDGLRWADMFAQASARAVGEMTIQYYCPVAGNAHLHLAFAGGSGVAGERDDAR